MKHVIDIQIACDEPIHISEDKLASWAELALGEQTQACELTLRLVDIEEMTELNTQYRKKTGPTNVLSFPSVLPEGIELDHHLLGDVIICPAVLAKEAQEQNRPSDAHWAHIVIHGVLHLLGHDHYSEPETSIMQNLEITLLAQLGYANPYQPEDNALE